MTNEQQIPPEWIIVYPNKKIFDSNDGAWEEAPGWGALAVVYQNRDNGWSTCTTGDYIRRNEANEFLPIDLTGLLDYVVNELGIIKVGRMVSRDEWGKILEFIHEDLMRGVVKTGYYGNERRE